MKRCFSIALILALFGTSVVSPALSEGMDVVGEGAEASVVEVGLIDGSALDFEGEVLTEPVEGLLDETPSSDAEDEEGDFGKDDSKSEDGEDGPDEEADSESEGQKDPSEQDGFDEEDEEISDDEDGFDGDSEDDPADEDDSALTTDEEEEEEYSDEEIASLTAAGAKIVSDFQISASSLSIGIKEKYKDLSVISLVEGREIPAVTWRSGNKKIATVNAGTGKITGVRTGSTTIYAKLAGIDTELSCKVTVKEAPGSVALNNETLTLSAGMNATLKASLPKDTASGKLTWSSNRNAVATVNAKGVITALKAGTATITVKTYNGKKATCKVKVVAAPASVAFPDSIIPMAEGQTAAVVAKALSKDGQEIPATITYALDENACDPGCVSLDAATGKLTGVRKGQAVFYATAQNGVAGRCVIEVDVAPKAVELNVSSISIGAKEVYVDILADFLPPDGADSCAQVVTWSSSDKKIAQVDANTGAVTGVKKGTATITATTPNGKTATCKVKVLKAPTSVSISPAVGALNVGEKGEYKVTLPSGCGGSLSYESSNTDVATIDSMGVVTAVGPGTATITVTTYNGKSKTAELQVSGNGPSESDGSKSGNAEKIKYLLSIAQKKLECPYVYGSFGPNSFDCSGFVYWCYKQLNIKLKDSAYKQGYDTRYAKISYANLIPGDVVFFNTVDDDDLSDHAGIYLGNGRFIHASSSARKVIISKLTSGYYQRNFSWGRRILNY